MGLLDTLYAAAANAGLLQMCVWRPSDGSLEQSHAVGFSAADSSLLDGLALSCEYAMTYPATVFTGLATREIVRIGGVAFQVREVRSIGDGSEMRVKLTRL